MKKRSAAHRGETGRGNPGDFGYHGLDPMAQDFKQLVQEAAARAEVRAAVTDLYRAVQVEIDARRPVCVVSGRCCRFEEFGHRLFVTTLEMAAFVHDLQQRPAVEPPAAPHSKVSLPVAWDGTGCPYQLHKLCSVHAFRPFGCRMFFCDATSTAWQNERYERFHADLKRLHETLQVPYVYREWRQALRDCLSREPDNL
jgi:Fe-S-cluster containining protein